MSGRDHETGIDGHCIPQCRECYIEKLEISVKNLQYHVDRLKDEVENLKYANEVLLQKVKDLEVDLACKRDGEGY